VIQFPQLPPFLQTKQKTLTFFNVVQKKLAEIQGRVRKLVEADAAVERVSWRLDKDWYAAHGVQLGP
jgi:hypothetical protein